MKISTSGCHFDIQDVNIFFGCHMIPAAPTAKYRKIPKISPQAYIFQRAFLRGLYSEGLIYGGKFVFQNRLG